jgi:pimeloyl-ACP methyl ester carboxylesterase
MKVKATSLLVSALVLQCGLLAQTAQSGSAPKRGPKYGSNPAAGKTFTHDGVRLYYEIYGAGEPLLIVHGNGGSIADIGAQIDYFRTRYQVIAMDSRDHGKSADSPDKLDYEKMSGDLAALLEHLNTGPAFVLGWSDGGIEALLLGIHYPAKVKKIAAMAANLNPSDKALHPEAVAFIKDAVGSMSSQAAATPQAKRELKVTQMMLVEPNIDVSELGSIEAPTLIMVGDHDVIRPEHAVEIYQHLPNGALKILRNATHMAPQDDPARFNRAVDRFFRNSGSVTASFDLTNPRTRAQEASLYD